MPSAPRVVDQISAMSDFAGALTDGYFLRYDAGAGTFGLAAVAGSVTSVFGRNGVVVAASGDYTVGQITGAAPLASPTFTGTPAAPTAIAGTNTTQLATTAFVLGQGFITSAPAGANPSASVGLSATNGSASTFLRSDAAPALSQAIVPTWTGEHIFAAPVKFPVITYPSDVFNLTSTSGGQYGFQWSNQDDFHFVRQGVGGLAGFRPDYGIVVRNGFFFAFCTGDTRMQASATPDVYMGRTGTRTAQLYGNFVVACQNAADLPLTVSGTASQAGVMLQLKGQSSTTAGREQADIDTAWATSTDATRKAKLILRVWDTAARESVVITATGAGSTVALNGSVFDESGYGFPLTPTFVLALGTPATTGTNKTNSLIVPRNGKIVKCFAAAKTGPTSADLIFDINLNGTSIWASTQANRLKILAGTTSGNQTSFDTTAVTEGDQLTIDIDQIGSSVAGQDVTVSLLLLVRNP